jgi:hypothetical protein
MRHNADVSNVCKLHNFCFSKEGRKYSFIHYCINLGENPSPLGEDFSIFVIFAVKKGYAKLSQDEP